MMMMGTKNDGSSQSVMGSWSMVVVVVIVSDGYIMIGNMIIHDGC